MMEPAVRLETVAIREHPMVSSRYFLSILIFIVYQSSTDQVTTRCVQLEMVRKEVHQPQIIEGVEKTHKAM